MRGLGPRALRPALLDHPAKLAALARSALAPVGSLVSLSLNIAEFPQHGFVVFLEGGTGEFAFGRIKRLPSSLRRCLEPLLEGFKVAKVQALGVGFMRVRPQVKDPRTTAELEPFVGPLVIGECGQGVPGSVRAVCCGSGAVGEPGLRLRAEPASEARALGQPGAANQRVDAELAEQGRRKISEPNGLADPLPSWNALAGKHKDRAQLFLVGEGSVTEYAMAVEPLAVIGGHGDEKGILSAPLFEPFEQPAELLVGVAHLLLVLSSDRVSWSAPGTSAEAEPMRRSALGLWHHKRCVASSGRALGEVLCGSVDREFGQLEATRLLAVAAKT